MRRDVEKSRSYYYGEGREFPTRDAAMRQALYKRNSMLAEIEKSTKIKLDGEPQIKDVYGNALQVQIPIAWES